MPRNARKNYLPGYYHIMIRGINKEAIFDKWDDRRFFRNMFRRLFRENQVDLTAYCIMNNHVHFLVCCDLLCFSKAVQRLNLSYAQKYNSENKRVGHVFQNRYKSEYIDSDDCLLEALRYIHNNPVKAGVVLTPGEYRWSSYDEFLKAGKKYHFTSPNQRNLILEKFAFKVSRFQEFHHQKNMRVFIDTDEDLLKTRKEIANIIINESLNCLNLAEVKDLREHREKFTELAKKLILKTKLNYQEIADLLKVNKSYVYRASQKIE